MGFLLILAYAIVGSLVASLVSRGLDIPIVILWIPLWIGAIFVGWKTSKRA